MQSFVGIEIRCPSNRFSRASGQLYKNPSYVKLRRFGYGHAEDTGSYGLLDYGATDLHGSRIIPTGNASIIPFMIVCGCIIAIPIPRGSHLA